MPPSGPHHGVAEERGIRAELIYRGRGEEEEKVNCVLSMGFCSVLFHISPLPFEGNGCFVAHGGAHIVPLFGQY